MRNHIWASATLALVIAACGSSPSTSSAQPCTNAGAAHHAYVVVQHLAGGSIQKCVGFAEDTIDGQALMDKSGIEYQAQTFSFGKGACQIDNEPVQFSACFPQGKAYWSLFIDTAGAWTTANKAYNDYQLHDKEALGWHYVQPTDANALPPPLPKQ